MAKSLKRLVMLASGVTLTLAALVYFLYHLRDHWGDVAEAFETANYLYVVPALGLLVLVYALRVVRWRAFLKPIGKVRYFDIASATCIGFMSSCVLPLRAGEVIRPYTLHRKAKIPFGHAAGTAMGLERIFDLIGVCFLLLLTSVLMSGHVHDSGPPAGSPGSAVQAQTRVGSAPAGAEEGRLTVEDVMLQIRAKGMLFAFATAVGLLGLLALAVFPAKMLRVAEFFLRPVPAGWTRKLMAFLHSVAQSMQFLKSPAQVLFTVLLSFALWLCFPASTYYLAKGFDLGLTWVGALLVQVILTAAVAAPQAPGYIGVFSAATMMGVELCGASKGGAGAFSMLLWVLHVVPITVVGLGFLWYEGLTLRSLARDSKLAAAQAGTPGGQSGGSDGT